MAGFIPPPHPIPYPPPVVEEAAGGGGGSGTVGTCVPAAPWLAALRRELKVEEENNKSLVSHS